MATTRRVSDTAGVRHGFRSNAARWMKTQFPLVVFSLGGVAMLFWISFPYDLVAFVAWVAAAAMVAVVLRRKTS